YPVTQFWIESDRVSYVLPSGTSGEVALTEVDWARTTELKSERGVPVVLRARQRFRCERIGRSDGRARRRAKKEFVAFEGRNAYTEGRDSLRLLVLAIYHTPNPVARGVYLSETQKQRKSDPLATRVGFLFCGDVCRGAGERGTRRSARDYGSQKGFERGKNMIISMK